MKQYRNLIYERIKQFYRPIEEEENQAFKPRITSSSLNNPHTSQSKNRSIEHDRNRPIENHQIYQQKYSQSKNRQGHNSSYNYTGIKSPHYHPTSPNELTRKNSLKDILRNKSNHRPSEHLTRYNSGYIHHNSSGMSNCANNQQQGYGQSQNAQKYYKKSNPLSAAIYKENKLSRHA